MGTIFIVALAIVIWRYVQKRSAELEAENAVIGKATDFEPCPHCLTVQSHIPHGKGEVISRGGWHVVRQYFTCPHCRVVALWHRRLDSFVWTPRRAGW